MSRHRTITTVFALGTALVTVGTTLLFTMTARVVEGQPPFEDTACLECHTDPQRLNELAVKEEAPEEPLSSGPG